MLGGGEFSSDAETRVVYLSLLRSMLYLHTVGFECI